MHPCELIYKIGGEHKIYGDTAGVCRITGNESIGIPFEEWVKDTFTDWPFLKKGDIISNEALFTFDEASEIVMQKAEKEKLQRFRTYSHIVYKGEWFCLTKADKKRIYEMVCDGAELVILSDSGQKHIVFKHRDGYWQLEESFIEPNIEILEKLHSIMMELISFGFSQTEILTGKYLQSRIIKCDFEKWYELENNLKEYRGSKIMDFSGWLLYSEKQL